MDDLAIKTATQEQQIKTLFENQKEIKADVKKALELANSINQLAMSIQGLAEQMKRAEESQAAEMKELKKQFSEVSKEVKEIQLEPANNYKKVIGIIVGSVVAAVIGFFTARFFR